MFRRRLLSLFRLEGGVVSKLVLHSHQFLKVLFLFRPLPDLLVGEEDDEEDATCHSKEEDHYASDVPCSIPGFLASTPRATTNEEAESTQAKEDKQDGFAFK
nr:unnamed protein product [Spirometra erinaceieuropaei]